ncbi:uncharacterized protein LY89DRAFT_617265 [Mollisia scopiformis]|uniref:SYO1-like TPR repeats domain-containing protein n=1 Tax=Mollisia scopiformis TaxID=149040 RepID=A0A194X8T7_MOLSC|nr:uncharacterized protein LY89DRAFT_617265 [Mollisia scopiformis]KUJ16197.1 hypothetical protein LY89DRAFT_617265 [Mollisia scopiformis]
MGKSKPRVRAKNRVDPTSKPIKPPADPELAAIREQRILPVLQDLQCSDVNKRSAAARAITNLIEDTKSRKLLLREQIVRILFEQTLTDSNLGTRTDGWGILRNLALEEDADFCVHLYRKDVLTAIQSVITTIIQTINSKDVPLMKQPKSQQQLVWNLATSVVSLLSSLCGTEEDVVEAVSRIPSLLDFLFGLLSFEPAPSELRHEVLSCMMALTEDNKDVAQQIVDSSDEFKLLLNIKDSERYESVTACGILHNIFGAMQWFDHNTPLEGTSDAILIPVLTKHMDQIQASNGANGHSQHSSPDQVLQLALEITASIASGLQEALEHGSRNEKEFEGFEDEPTGDAVDEMDADVDDEAEDGEEHDVDGDHEMNEDEIDADMALVIGDGPSEDENLGEELTLDHLIQIATPKIIVLAQQTLAASNAYGNKNHALAALNNIAWTVSSIDFSTGHLEKLKRAWISSAQSIWNDIISFVLASNTADVELASAVTSLAWAVAKSIRSTIRVEKEEQRKFMALYQASKGMSLGSQSNGAKAGGEDVVDAFQGLGVKCIGVLGTLALDPAPIALNREIGVFLITVLSSLPDLPPADAVEALNQIFDIYADKSYAFDDPVFWGDNLYKHLEELLPKVKAMAKTIDKRKFGELRARADEANLNLGRFLVYKRKERKSKADD